MHCAAGWPVPSGLCRVPCVLLSRVLCPVPSALCPVSCGPCPMSWLSTVSRAELTPLLGRWAGSWSEVLARARCWGRGGWLLVLLAMGGQQRPVQRRGRERVGAREKRSHCLGKRRLETVSPEVALTASLCPGCPCRGSPSFLCSLWALIQCHHLGHDSGSHPQEP